MGLFSFSNKKKELIPSAQHSEPNQKSQSLIWLEASSEAVYQETLQSMRADVVNGRNYPTDRQKQLARAFSGAFLTKLGKIDRSRLTLRQKQNLSILIFDEYPSIVAKMETELIDIDGYRDEAVDRFGEKLISLLRNYVDGLPRKIPVPQLISTTNENATEKLESLGTEEVDQKLKEVTKLAEDAFKSAANIDDRFFSEQAINSYIPDSVRFLTGLTQAPENMKTEAYALFIRQLEAIEQQLNSILGRSMHGSLSQMKAHTEFLESRKDQLQLE